MCRHARIKLDNGTYHIIVKGMNEFLLYKNNLDKNKFLSLVKKYQLIFRFKVYAYCLMDTHAHFLINSNGADISDFMHSINQSYAQYYNSTHNRKGHVFENRFKSKLITSDRYLLTVSAYIHRNPKDIKKYTNCVEKYKFSSLPVYLGLNYDVHNILDTNYIVKIFNPNSNIKTVRKAYLSLVNYCSDDLLNKIDSAKSAKSNEINHENKHEISNKPFTSEQILLFISKYTNTPKWKILIKNCKNTTYIKSLYTFMLRSIGNLKYKEISKILGNLTESRISVLCSTGFRIIETNVRYKNIINDFLCVKPRQ